MKEFFSNSFSAIAVLAVIGLSTVGGLYWFWIAIKISSFLMFVIGFFPPTGLLFATPVGAWSLLFGVPDWVFTWFG